MFSNSAAKLIRISGIRKFLAMICYNVNMCINSYGKHAVGHACRNHKVFVYDVLLFSQ